MSIKQSHIKTHAISVGTLMRDKCLSFWLETLYAEKMFSLWYLHDIAKEVWYSDNHAKKWWEILESLWYEYRMEVFYHWQLNVPYASKELDLLNECDLQVLPNWHIVTFDVRLADIWERYWFNSQVYEDAKLLWEQLGLL